MTQYEIFKCQPLKLSDILGRNPDHWLTSTIQIYEYLKMYVLFLKTKHKFCVKTLFMVIFNYFQKCSVNISELQAIVNKCCILLQIKKSDYLLKSCILIGSELSLVLK